MLKSLAERELLDLHRAARVRAHVPVGIDGFADYTVHTVAGSVFVQQILRPVPKFGLNLGARLDLDSIPRPDGVDLYKWLITFPSYGFLLCASPDERKEICELFEQRDGCLRPSRAMRGA